MTTELRRILRTALALSAMAVFAAGCGGAGGGGGGGGEQPVVDEEESVQGQVLVGADTYPSADAEAKIAAIGTVVQVNEHGAVYGVDLKPGLTLADAKGIEGGAVRFVEKNYLAHNYAAETAWSQAPGPQYNAAVKAEVEAAWTSYASIRSVANPVDATGSITGLTDTSMGTVSVNGVLFLTGNGSNGTFDTAGNPPAGAQALVNVITAAKGSNPALASVTATVNGTVNTTVDITSPGVLGNAVTLSATGDFTASGPHLTGGSGGPGSGTLVKIAVIDSGVNCAHEDLVNKCIAGRNIIANAAITAGTDSDDVGHGTEVAGVAAAETGNSKGIAGIAGGPLASADPLAVQIIPVKVSSATIKANHALIAKGIDWAVLNGADIIVLSLGSSTGSYTLQHAIEGAWSAGVLVVAAAGNASSNAMRYPAAYQTAAQNVLSVGYVDFSDAITTTGSGTSYGTWVNVLAPGASIIAPTIGGNTAYTDPAVTAGSTYAAAFAAGEAALIKSAYPSLTNAQLRKLLVQSVETYGRTSGRTISATGGRVNVKQALALAATPAQTEVAGLVLASSSSLGGKTVAGTIVLLNPGNSAVTVNLSSDATSLATVPATVTIAAGKASATFNVTTVASAAGGTANITAEVASGKGVTAKLAVNAPAITKVACSPVTLVVGQKATCTVSLDSVAPSGSAFDVTIGATNAHVALAQGVSSPLDLQGVSSKTFQVVGASNGVAKVQAKIGNGAWVQSADVTVGAATLTVSFTSATVAGGSPIAGKLTLNGKLPADTVVHFAAGNAAVTAPADVTIKAGATSGTFSATTGAVDATVTTTLTASVTSANSADIAVVQGGSGKDAAVVVQGLSVASIDLPGTAPFNVTEAAPITGTVTLSAAPTGNSGVDVPLSLSSDLCYLNVAKVNVAKGATKSGNFIVTCAEPSAKTTVTITAQPAGTTAKTATLTVLPTLASIAVYVSPGDTVAATSLKAGDVLDVVVTLNARQASDIAVGVNVAKAANANTSLPTVGGTDYDSNAKTLTVKTNNLTNKFTLTGAGSVGGGLVVTVSYGAVTLTKSLTYAAPALTALAASNTTLLMGGTTRVTATTEAASGATDVALTYTSGAFQGTTSKITVSNGATSGYADLTAVASGLTSTKAVTLTAQLGTVKKTAAVSILPATFTSVTAPQAWAVGANNAVVTLSAGQDLTCAVATANGWDGTVATVGSSLTLLKASATTNLPVTGLKSGTAGTVNVTCGGVTKTLSVVIP